MKITESKDGNKTLWAVEPVSALEIQFTRLILELLEKLFNPSDSQ